LAGATNTGDQGPLGLPGSPTPPRLDHRYELTDRTGTSMGLLPLQTIQTLIRQGRLFRTDLVSRDGAPSVTLGEVAEFQSAFDETMPPVFQVAGAVMRPRPELAGPLDRTALAGVFARLFQEGRTGRLFLVGADRRQEKVVIFQRGVPVNAMSNIAEEQLGELLIQHGVITADTFAQAVDQRRDQGGRLGSALIALQAMTPRELHRALSIQAMERLLNAFRQQEGSFRFVPDDTAADEEILLFATTREIIETGLHAALGPAEIAAELAGIGEAPLRVNNEAVSQPWGRTLQAGDAEIFGLIGAGTPAAALVDAAARTLRWTSDEARLRVLSLLKYGVVEVGELGIRRLEDALRGLEAQHAFDALGLSRTATTTEIAAALEHKLSELEARPVPGEPPGVARLREKIRVELETAARTLSDENTRAMYERALQLGLDFDQPEVRSRLQYEHALNKGKSALTLQKYDEARRAFMTATEAMPEEPLAYVHLGWAQFLASSRDANAGAAAVREVERALRLQGDLDVGHMTVGKIHRLAGNFELAEKHLRHAIALNPHNNEAQSELRLIFTREIDGKAPGAKSRRVQLDGGLPVTLTIYGVVVGLLFVLATIVPGSYTEFPEAIRPESNHLVEVPKAIPSEWQVMGILEYYYFAADPMWWIRRVLLLAVGLLGMRFLVNRDGKSPVEPFAKNFNWVFLGIPYGVLVGFLSPHQLTGEALGITLGMTAFHVFAEQAFFIGFICRALFKEFREPLIPIALTAALFGVYHLSYWSILNASTRQMLLDVLQIGAFAGGAYATLLWRSGGMLAPGLAHFLINGVMMVSSYMRYRGQ
jgi:membrane protease YdiL (CAAX protease family)